MLKFALRNLLSRPTRTLLSLLGLTVAILGMVGLFSVAVGLDQLISSTFNRIPGLLAMQPGAPIPLFSRIPTAWGEEIAEVPGVTRVSPEIWQRVNVIDSKMTISPPRFLFGADIPSRLVLDSGIYRDEILPGLGRFLEPSDAGTLNTVISRQIAEEFNKTVGDTLQVNGYDLTIVGIYHCGSILLDVAIILDIDVVRQMTRFEENSVCAFYIESDGAVDDEEIAVRVREKFRGRELKPFRSSLAMMAASQGAGGSAGGLNWENMEALAEGSGSLPENPVARFMTVLFRSLQLLAGDQAAGGELPMPGEAVEEDGSTAGAAVTSPGKNEESAVARAAAAPASITDQDPELPLEVRTASEWAERFDRLSDDLDIFLTIMTGIGVVIAVLSIINTMLMSVTERIIEFGILKANGWTRVDVLKLVTLESALIGFAGGLLGSSLGKVATWIINSNWPTRVSLYASPGLLLFGVGFSLMLGVAGGLYPAMWAMRMMPMDAIRRG
ncbi:MAG: ABC transporter permease [Planctomycetaceae bacterium]|nr:ABC transporter permease [Planctomycetaceae bacterium]